MKYIMGDYIVLKFGEYGDKLGKDIAQSYKEARYICNSHEKQAKENSAVVMRVIWNSKDDNNKWNYKEEAE